MPPSLGSEQLQQKMQDQPLPGLAVLIIFLRVRGCRFTRHMSSLEKLIPRGRLRMRSLQWHLKLHWFPERDPPNLPVPRSRQVEEDPSWWMVRGHLSERRPQTSVYTRMRPERAGELTSSTSQCRGYGHTRRAHYTSISWR